MQFSFFETHTGKFFTNEGQQGIGVSRAQLSMPSDAAPIVTRMMIIGSPVVSHRVQSTVTVTVTVTVSDPSHRRDCGRARRVGVSDGLPAVTRRTALPGPAGSVLAEFCNGLSHRGTAAGRVRPGGQCRRQVTQAGRAAAAPPTGGLPRPGVTVTVTRRCS